MTAPGIADTGTVAPTAAAIPLITADALAVGYSAAPVLSEVTFSLRAGERIGVLGPNGGGKTTLFRALLGELSPLAGSLDTAARCGTVPQTERSRLDFPVSALDVALMGAIAGRPWWKRPGRAERAAAHAALERVGLDALAERAFGELSGGQRQRVLVARALVQDARIVLLDEPFTGLDNVSVQRLEGLLDELAGEGRGVLIATHDVDQARAWDQVLCINRRQVAFGPPRETLTLEVLAATYGGSIVTLPQDGGERLAILPPHHHDH
ncbi:metal ABC transporter ATP-binding protein [Conexibacter sp. CPCC 206217]|uniref:metal ABC transporter ATP-binding protein n=1 Tax=Conexibacter sp. CPCC 206217 TaxID=3064574 RepID=UPI002717F8E7|nr:metal ABC transporter ATP-binding protein [Conexibacter sp. CPCC 206217]MDO8212982.1 metal ABC transporter ATP-binding protein [Conexibacter sp. CPCC 206217]